MLEAIYATYGMIVLFFIPGAIAAIFAIPLGLLALVSMVTEDRPMWQRELFQWLTWLTSQAATLILVWHFTSVFR